MVKIAFLGDVSFNDEYNDLFFKGINPFSRVEEILHKSDFVVGNLECLAQGNKGENLLKKPRLKTRLDTLEYLKNLNLGLTTLAHNHVYDNLLDGFKKTIGFLNDNDIGWLGAGENKEEAQKPFIKTISNLKFCFLNFVSPDTHPNLPPDSPVFLNWLEEEKVIKEIRNNKNCDYIILLFHWGGKFEGGKYPAYDQIIQARKFIREGADLIIGHHTHTFQPVEIYYEKYILYSLGNFCFANVMSDNRIKFLRNKKYLESFIVEVNFYKSGYSLIKVPIINNNLLIQPQSNIKYKYKVRQVLFAVMSKLEFFWKIYRFNYLYIEPVKYQLFRKDEKKSFLKRLMNLNWEKVKKLMNSRK